MSIPVDQSGPAGKAASSSQDQTAEEGHDMVMDVEGDSGGVGGKTSGDDDGSTTSKKKSAEETAASDDEASGPACPLFMSGLPSDFASNPSLAAIASLLGDEEYGSDVDVSKVRKGLRQGGQDNSTTSGGGKAAAAAAVAAAAKPRAGGGKVGGAGAARRSNMSGSKKKSGSHHRPYPTSDKKKGETEQKATVGEAQLFLNMWKL